MMQEEIQKEHKIWGSRKEGSGTQTGSGEMGIQCSVGQEGGTGREGGRERWRGHSSAMAAQALDVSPHGPAQDTL